MTTTGRKNHIVVERRTDCAIVSLNRPQALNALTVPMLSDLGDVLEALADDTSCRVVVLTGAGRAFCAGVDLKELQRRPLSGGRIGEDFDDEASRITTLLSSMGKPTIAAINGACFTGGLELTLACDIIVAADEASLGDTHAKWGLRPTWGMTQRLGRAVGPVRARMLSYSARTFSGREAVTYGLAAESVPLHDLLEYVFELATEIAANSPEALAAYKDLYAVSDCSFLQDGLGTERDREYAIVDTRERLERFTLNRSTDQ